MIFTRNILIIKQSLPPHLFAINSKTTEHIFVRFSLVNRTIHMERLLIIGAKVLCNSCWKYSIRKVKRSGSFHRKHFFHLRCNKIMQKSSRWHKYLSLREIYKQAIIEDVILRQAKHKIMVPILVVEGSKYIPM